MARECERNDGGALGGLLGGRREEDLSKVFLQLGDPIVTSKLAKLAPVPQFASNESVDVTRSCGIEKAVVQGHHEAINPCNRRQMILQFLVKILADRLLLASRICAGRGL
jgi:hypothetical protein